MKAAIHWFTAISILGTAQAAEVKSAKLDASGKTIEIEVVHGGGCGTHDYRLKLGACFETFPVKCKAELVHVSHDPCEALLVRTAKVSLSDAGIVGDYFANGSLTITGERNSKATLKLPAVIPTTTPKATATCVTNTGSDLSIFAAEKRASLKTVTGEKAEMKITAQRMVVIETYPSIDQNTYSLDDGRQIITEFRTGETAGRGYWIRTSGGASPKFTCQR